MKSGRSFLSGLLAGAVIGGILALLYAPKAGKETREDIRAKFADLEKELEELRSKAGQKAGKIRDSMAEKLAELQKEIENLSKSL